MGAKGTKIVGDAAAALNRLGREQMKRRLLADILMDMTICQIEGWDAMAYLHELQVLITDLLRGERKGPSSN